MPNLRCPACGEAFHAVTCQCRGQILRAEAWTLGRWDWRPVFGSFADNVRPMDIDFIVERNGRFLVFETKAPGVEIAQGQRRALQALSRLPQFTVAVLWGAPDEVQTIQRVRHGRWGTRYPITNPQLWHFCAQWWTHVANNRKRPAPPV